MTQSPPGPKGPGFLAGPGEEFDVGALFPAVKETKERRTSSVRVPWSPIGHVGLAVLTAAGVVTGLDASGVGFAPGIVAVAAVLVVVASLVIWSQWGPLWAVVSAFLLVTLSVTATLLTVYTPAVLAVLAVTTLVIRSVRRPRTPAGGEL